MLFPKLPFDLVAIAASAGGVTALRKILARVAVPFSTPIVIVQHLPPFVPSQLSDVLGWRTRLSTKFACHGERLRAGTVYVAPPNRHLVLGNHSRLELDDSPRWNHVRPAADHLLISAAERLGGRVLCVVLTGNGFDGAAGAAAVKECGGVVIVQDPETAEADAMPRAALAATEADLVLPLEAIPSALNSLCEVIGTRELFCRAYVEPSPLSA
ncbi:MAG TPA: chemotaxis protein CheB [Steroidobacteraceae bacterium]|nr:chemotaxis protein CheB [Steroidobacteraceae bacterium]